MQLKDKVAIVTGAAQGIGLACATRFIREGAKVVIADVNVEKGEAAAALLTEAGGDAMFIACDVGDKARVDAMVEATVARYAGLDIMISNAAILHTADIIELEEADGDRGGRIKLKGFFLTG